MKLRLLLFTVALLAISCNDDEGENPVNSQEKNLKSISVYDSDGNNTIIDKILFEDNKPVDKYIYMDGEVSTHIKFTYNASGQLILNERFNASDSTLLFENSITYDEQGRMNQTVSEWYSPPILPVQNDYVYNDNTITCTLSGIDIEPNSEFHIYHLDQNGQVYKIIKDNEYATELNYDYVEEVTYSGNNILSWSLNGYYDEIGEYEFINDYHYTYNSVPVKGQFLKFYKNMLGDYTPNAYLYGGYITGFEISDNYLESREDAQSNIITWEYEFDDEGYPVSQKKFLNGELSTETIIEYQD